MYRIPGVKSKIISTKKRRGETLKSDDYITMASHLWKHKGNPLVIEAVLHPLKKDANGEYVRKYSDEEELDVTHYRHDVRQRGMITKKTQQLRHFVSGQELVSQLPTKYSDDIETESMKDAWTVAAFNASGTSSDECTDSDCDTIEDERDMRDLECGTPYSHTDTHYCDDTDNTDDTPHKSPWIDYLMPHKWTHNKETQSEIDTNLRKTQNKINAKASRLVRVNCAWPTHTAVNRSPVECFVDMA